MIPRLGPKKKSTSDFWGKELTQTTGQGLDLKQGKQWAARFSPQKKQTFLDSLFEVRSPKKTHWNREVYHPNTWWRGVGTPKHLLRLGDVKGVVKHLVTHQVFGRFWMYVMILQVSGYQPPFIRYLWIYKPWKGQLTGKQPYLGGAY